MKVNRGKDFEEQIRQAFTQMPDTSVMRLKDPQSGYAGDANICDFVVYHKPVQYLIECKSCYGNTLSIHSNNPKRAYGDITNTQWLGLLNESAVPGICAGVMIWFIDHDRTIFVPIRQLEEMRNNGAKSCNVKKLDMHYTEISGTKRRILFNYDMTTFFEMGEREYGTVATY